MKTIKIIDLLNKIANGEEVPQKIRIGALYMYWDGSAYWDEDGETSFCEVIGSSEYGLNREVEIIEEEEKEIEKCDVLKHCVDFTKNENVLLDNQLGLQKKISELIDAVNEIRRGN